VKSKRKLFKVRVRENGVKKTRFYRARSNREARDMYKGNGRVMWTERVGFERLLGVGSFFRLGDDLLNEFRRESQTNQIPVLDVSAAARREADRERTRKKRRFHEGRESGEETPYDYPGAQGAES